VDQYLIFISDKPDIDSLFFFHTFTADTTYTHEEVNRFSNRMFYRIVSFIGRMERLKVMIEGENAKY